MRALILSAGRGERMRPLTDTLPKALLEVHGKPLIVYHLEALSQVGVKDVVINLAYRGDQIKQALGDGNQWSLTLHYSPEPPGGYETAGGIIHALPLLGNSTFIVVNCDVFTDYSFASLPRKLSGLAHLVLVDNPSHHPEGDFSFTNNQLSDANSNRLTFAGIGVYHPDLFSNYRASSLRLAPVLRQAISNQQVTAEHYTGQWMDIGTPERLEQDQNQKFTVNK